MVQEAQAVPDEGQPQEDQAPSGEPTTTQATASERLQALREEIGEEEFDRLPQVNDRAQSIAAKQRDKDRKEDRAKLEEQRRELVERDQKGQEARQFMTNWAATLPDQQVKLLQNPTFQTRFNDNLALASQAGPSQEAYAAKAVKDVGKALKALEGLEDLPYEQLSEEHANDLPGFWAATVKYGMKDKEKAMEKQIADMREAITNEVLAKLRKVDADPDASAPEGEAGLDQSWKDLSADDKIALALEEKRKKK